ncbi:MAG: putative molybdenum carrier protein [Candidatus Thiodiazotropha sp.]
MIDGEELSERRAAERIIKFITDKEIAILNVAGPRASGDARAYDYTRAVIATASRSLIG